MKVVLLISVALTAVSAGSGPYLPSGWKPSGPAFYLPGEVATTKPADNPLKDTLQVEAEGSDFLKEYGPPKTTEVQEKTIEVVEITKQELPEVVIARNFAEIRTNIIADDEIVDSVTETVEVGGTDEISAADKEVTAGVSSDATTENVKEINDDVTAISNTDANVAAEVESEVTTQTVAEPVTEIVQNVVQSEEIAQENASAAVKTEEIVQENENANSLFVSSVEQREGKSVVVTLEEQRDEAIGAVQSIEDALVNLENEIKAQQVQNIEAVAEVKTVEENSGSVQQNLPEGFLEYGPPGFQEYGPPKQQLPTVEAEDAAVPASETRRRRFSPKFRQARRTNH